VPDDEGIAKVAELSKEVRIGMLTTRAPDGLLVSRPMALQEVEFDGDYWFFAARDSRLVQHVRADPRVSVSLGSADTWVSVAGHAEVVEDRDKAEELWNAAVGAWFPGGPHDPGVVLLKVVGESAEYWDTPGGRVATVLSLVKATVTGRPYDGGENETVRL
jgi:general stress protein 26